uniref:Uncharacterized protein n=1 Tax=Arundo donax TaxID=35708 RepID=A0A0A9B7T0_ARUDO
MRLEILIYKHVSAG